MRGARSAPFAHGAPSKCPRRIFRSDTPFPSVRPATPAMGRGGRPDRGGATRSCPSKAFGL
eukprot:7890348-Pyramimonas_sp.AAC.1